MGERPRPVLKEATAMATQTSKRAWNERNRRLRPQGAGPGRENGRAREPIPKRPKAPRRHRLAGLAGAGRRQESRSSS